MMFSKPTLWQSQTNNERIDYLNRLANEVSARDRRGEMFVVNGGIRPGGINETSDVLSINANFIAKIHRIMPSNQCLIALVWHSNDILRPILSLQSRQSS